jgi:hypothetical protein
MRSLSIRKDLTMSEQAKQTPQELKQDVLHRIDAARKAIEELSEEDLASLVGGSTRTIPLRSGRGGGYHTMGSSDDPALMPVRSRNTDRGAYHTMGSSDDPALMV